LPVRPGHSLEIKPPERHWLIETLCLIGEAVGIVEGEPKCKSFLALDIRLGRLGYRLPAPLCGALLGPRALLRSAADALHVCKVCKRLEGICRPARVELENLDLQVITASGVRLDFVSETHVQPRLLVLDPCPAPPEHHENHSGEAAPLRLGEPQRIATR
jgi:hypothetical protein